MDSVISYDGDHVFQVAILVSAVSLKLSLHLSKGTDVRILSDNSIVVSHLNRQEGTRSRYLLDLSFQIVALAEGNLSSLVAIHLSKSKKQTF